MSLQVVNKMFFIRTVCILSRFRGLCQAPSTNLIYSIASLMATVVYAEGPTVYGLINKEIRNFSQSSEANGGEGAAGTFAITDVDGFESRFGIKGGGDLTNSKYTYLLEVGLNSNLDYDESGTTTDESRIRLRHSMIAVEGGFGKVLVGNYWRRSALPRMFRYVFGVLRSASMLTLPQCVFPIYLAARLQYCLLQPFLICSLRLSQCSYLNQRRSSYG